MVWQCLSISVCLSASLISSSKLSINYTSGFGSKVFINAFVIVLIDDPSFSPPTICFNTLLFVGHSDFDKDIYPFKGPFFDVVLSPSGVSFVFSSRPCFGYHPPLPPLFIFSTLLSSFSTISIRSFKSLLLESCSIG